MPIFGRQNENEMTQLQEKLAATQAQVTQLQAWVHDLRGTDTPTLEAALRSLRAAVEHARDEEASVRTELLQVQEELAQVREQVVETREEALLQEVGIYEYSHPLQDALAYKDALAALRARIKTAAKGDGVTCQVDWAINGSIRQGQRMGNDIAKLMLRAYNTEADNAVRLVKAHSRDAVKARLTKTRDMVAKLGTALQIVISADYHRLRLEEIDLTADYLMRLEVEKEAASEERERLREEAKAMREYERERARLSKEHDQYRNAAVKLQASGGDPAEVASLEGKVAEIEAAMKSVETRAANIRTGWVYVISNLGAFGPNVVKIGLTRRLDPLDRVRELGDASVPFRFDYHALIFSADAVSLETSLHNSFADRRVNLVNMRREFFYATPAEVRDALLDIPGEHLVEYKTEPEALEWRVSHQSRRSEPPPDSMDRPLAVTNGQAVDDGDLSDDGLS